MISFLRGQVIDAQNDPPRVVVLTSCGVGYSVSLPVFVHQELNPSRDDEVELHIYYSVSERQPLPLLVGFQHQQDRDFFEQFIQVEGIGPARAAAALIMPVPTLAHAIETEDTATITSMPGIGQRGAQKIVASLKGKVTDAAMRTIDTSPDIPPISAGARADVIAVLVNLGYRNAEAATLADDAIRREPELADDAQALLQRVFRERAASPTVA